MNVNNDFEITLGTDGDVSKKIKHMDFSCNKTFVTEHSLKHSLVVLALDWL